MLPVTMNIKSDHRKQPTKRNLTFGKASGLLLLFVLQVLLLHVLGVLDLLPDIRNKGLQLSNLRLPSTVINT